jgi:hypothetical protein
MKKVLLFCLAAMLVVALTLPAVAKTDLTARGEFTNTGYYLSNIRAMNTAGSATSASFQEMYGSLTFRLQTAPNLWFELGTKFADRDWGYWQITGGSPIGFNRYDDDSATLAKMGFTDGANFIEVDTAAMTWLVYKGYLYVGRGRSAPGGIGAMQLSKVGAGRDWKGSDSPYDTISTTQTFGVWAVNASAAKIAERDGYQTYTGTATADADYDSYSAGIGYNQKWGHVRADLNWTRDRAQWIPPYFWPDSNTYSIAGRIYYKLGKAIHLAAEGSYKFGGFISGGVEVMDIAGWDMCVQAEYIDGPYKIGAQFGWTNGQDPATLPTTANPKKTEGSSPGRWEGLYAAFGEFDGLLNDDSDYLGNYWDSTKTNSLAKGLQLFYGFADYKMMDKLWVHAAIGFMRWDEDPVDKNFGSEFDLGANYTIQPGLDLGLHFGYFIPGTWFTAPKGNHIHLDAELSMKF